MALRKEWVLHQAIVDVQYGRGIVFLDKCGSLMLKLEDLLGKAFEASVPSMEKGELRSHAERLTVAYGSRAFNVTQAWIKTAARVEHVAGGGWEVVSDVLSVSHTVTRVGVRFVMWAGADSKAEADEMFAKSPAASATPQMKGLIGQSPIRASSLIADDPRAKLRIGMETSETTVLVKLVDDLGALIPPHAFVLDLDHVFPSKIEILSKGDLRTFIRTSWQRSREIAKLVGEPFGMQDA
jgi:hypothetical protein